jgi:tagatose-1,6-bisphosphate aldolase
VAKSNAEIRSYERTRASNIIGDKVAELKKKLAAKPFAKNGQDVVKIINFLSRIQRDIMGNIKPYVQAIPREPSSDFSPEEIEAAMEFMKEEEENPFDG